MAIRRLLIFLCSLVGATTVAFATSNYDYGSDEYVTVAKGTSPNGKLAITAHGEGEYGDDHFHIFLTDVTTGKRVGPLTEIVDTLDTGAGAFCARWSQDSQQVIIVYRVSRHAPLKAVSYQISDRRARRLKGPFDVTSDELISYWQKQCSEAKPSEKTFGTPKTHPK